MRLSLFSLNPLAKSVLESNHLHEGRDLLYSLELYKFLSRERLVEACLDSHPTLRIIDPNAYNNDGLSMQTELKKLSEEFDVVIYQTGSDSVLVCVEMTKEVNLSKLELLLSAHKVTVVKVTPMNFIELKGEKITGYSEYILLQRYIIQGIIKGATDVHLGIKHNEFGIPEYYAALRIGNNLEECDLFHIDSDLNKRIITQLIDTKTSTHSADIDTIYGVVSVVPDVFGDGKVSFRVTASKAVGGYVCIGRIQKFSTTSLKISELGFPIGVQKDLNLTAKKLSGFTFITGGIRTGKNTTALALANNMILRPISILDISSPVEVLMPFPQIDYGGDAETLLEIVKRLKKMDADIVLVNELPDARVAMASRDLVNSNVHVVTTFHLNRAWHLPYKLKEYFGNEFVTLFSQMNLCVTQKMFPLLCNNCKTVGSVEFLPEEYKRILKVNGISTFSESKGCKVCRDELYETKVQPYVERIVFNENLVRKLNDARSMYEMELLLKEEVMQGGSLDKSIAEAVGRGEIHYTSIDSIL